MVDPTPDAFRALARSSPWRWTTLHFTHRDARGPVEAWLRRPGDLLVRTADGERHRVHERRGSASYVLDGMPARYTDAELRPARSPQPVPLTPQDVAPRLRPDGLVAERPTDPRIEYDDPMWQTYRWVAMLDPVELSHHVTVGSLREEALDGRRVWRAEVRAEEGYDPRCGGSCCELLWSDVSRRGGSLDPGDVPPVPPGTVYPDAYDVALDLQTGVVVRLAPIGGNRGDLAFATTLHEVDADLDRVLARTRDRPARRPGRTGWASWP